LSVVVAQLLIALNAEVTWLGRNIPARDRRAGSKHGAVVRSMTPPRKVVFYGQEKKPDTIRIAKMNLASTGWGENRRGPSPTTGRSTTWLRRKHGARGCDFVMANRRSTLDLVDPNASRRPAPSFGLPGVNKDSASRRQLPLDFLFLPATQ